MRRWHTDPVTLQRHCHWGWAAYTVRPCLIHTLAQAHTHTHWLCPAPVLFVCLAHQVYFLTPHPLLIILPPFLPPICFISHRPPTWSACYNNRWKYGSTGDFAYNCQRLDTKDEHREGGTGDVKAMELRRRKEEEKKSCGEGKGEKETTFHTVVVTAGLRVLAARIVGVKVIPNK